MLISSEPSEKEQTLLKYLAEDGNNLYGKWVPFFIRSFFTLESPSVAAEWVPRILSTSVNPIFFPTCQNLSLDYPRHWLGHG